MRTTICLAITTVIAGAIGSQARAQTSQLSEWETAVSYFAQGLAGTHSEVKPFSGIEIRNKRGGIVDPLNVTFSKSAESGGGQGGAFVHLTASSDSGLLSASIRGVFTSSNDERSRGGAELGQGEVVASFHDIWRLGSSDANAPDGTPIILRATLHLDGELSAVASGQGPNHAASVEAAVSIVGNRYAPTPSPTIGYILGHAKDDIFHHQKSLSLPPSTIPVALVVKVGEWYDWGLTMRLSARAQASSGTLCDFGLGQCKPGGVTAAFNADFAHTIRWGGISSAVYEDTGKPVENWSLTAASGFDYLRPYPVPEPTALALGAIAWSYAIASRTRPRIAGSR